MRSIRRKLLMTLIGALLAAGFTTATATFFSAQAEFNQFLDRHLKETAESLGASVMHSMPIGNPSHLTIVGDAQSYQIVVQVYDSATNSVWQREGKQRLPLPDGPGFALEKLDGKDWRTYSVAAGPLIITVGQDMAVRTELAAASAFRVLQPLCLLLPFIAIAVWIVVGDGLAPLERTARSVSRRSPTSLEPISTKGLPVELEGLVSAINHLLERLRESLSAQQRFASDAAHELRTPLTAINGWGETLLADDSGDTEQLRRGVRIILRESRRLTNMVEELLEFSKIEDGRFTLRVEQMDLQAEVEDAIYTYRELFHQDGIDLEYVNAGEMFDQPITGDPERLKQVLCNVLDNAAKHGGSGKRIVVSMEREEDCYAVRVRDFGPGIPEAELPYVKQKFYKGSSKARGSGIGLAVCDEIVRLHEGTFDIANAEGGGTVVTIRLPISREEE